MEAVGRREACAQGPATSSVPPSSWTRGLSAQEGQRAARPTCPAQPARPARPARAPTGRPPSPRSVTWLGPPGRGREVGARTSKPPERPAEPQAGGEQEEAAGPGPPHPATRSPGPVRSSTCAARCPPARPGVWRGAVPRQSRRGGALMRPAAVAWD